MPSSHSSHDRTMDAARLQRFRAYLGLLVRLQFSPRWQGKLDESDLVQQTLLRAVEGLGGFRGRTDAEMAAWLRQILARQMANTARDLGRWKRDLSRQRSLEATLDQSASDLEAYLAASCTSPSQNAQRNEQVFRLADALAILPEAQREALLLHHFQQQTLQQVAEQLGRSPTAVAGLIKRALRSLRSQLEEIN